MSGIYIMARRSYPKSKGKKRQARKRQARRTGGMRIEWASAKQTLMLPDDPFGTVFVLDDVNLGQFDRLSQIARAYQYFRINYIEMKWKPYQDTFVANGAVGEAVPYLHYLIDTGEVLIPASAGFNQMRDAGAKPIRMDDKTITVRWKPRVPIATAADSSYPVTLSYAQQTKKSPWLPTNDVANQDPFGWVASKVPHKGIYYGVEQAFNTLAPGENRYFGVEISVSCSFKKPLAFTNPPAEGLVPAPKKQVVAK